MPGLLDVIGALTNASRTRGGISTMPGTNELTYSPMQATRPGLDMFLSGGRGAARSERFNDAVMAALLQQQMAGKQQLEAIGRTGEETRKTVGTTGAETRLTNKDLAGYNESIAKLQADLNQAQATLQQKLNQQTEIARIQAQGTETRTTNEQASRLNKEIMQLQSEINDKSAILQQNLSAASAIGTMPRSDADLNVMGSILNTPAVASALRQIQMRSDVLNSPAGAKAYGQGLVGSMQAPALKNVNESRFLIPPANMATMPKMEESGLVNIPDIGMTRFGLVPFSEQGQQMITLPGGEQYPSEMRRTGYQQFGPSTVERPPQLRTPTAPTGGGSAMIPTMPPEPDLSGVTGGPAGLASLIGGGFPTGGARTSFYGGMPTMPQEAYPNDIRSLLRAAGNDISKLDLPDLLRRILGWETQQAR